MLAVGGSNYKVTNRKNDNSLKGMEANVQPVGGGVQLGRGNTMLKC